MFDIPITQLDRLTPLDIIFIVIITFCLILSILEEKGCKNNDKSN